MSIITLLIVILLVMLILGLPAWPHARGWGYGPSGVVLVILIIFVVLLAAGRI